MFVIDGLPLRYASALPGTSTTEQLLGFFKPFGAIRYGESKQRGRLGGCPALTSLTGNHSKRGIPGGESEGSIWVCGV
jgi:hypothetical protein